MEKGILIYSIIVLLLLGSFIVMSSSPAWAYIKTGDALSYSQRHLVYLLFGIIFSLIAYYLGIGFLKKIAPLASIISFLLLITLFIPGVRLEINNAKRWIEVIPGLTFQPSNLALSFYLIYSSLYFSNLKNGIKIFKDILPHLIVTMILAGIIYLEPDFGGALMLAGMGFYFYFLSGIPARIVIPIILIFSVLIGVLILIEPYRMERILSYINPDERASYQVKQSLEAIRSGGLIGLGLGRGKARLLYLPQSYSDFSLSVYLEETGYLGGLLLFVTIFIFLFSGFKTILSSKDLFSIMYGSSVLFKISLYILINSAVSIALIPVKGLPFPFLSYGGTFLVITMVEMGLILSIGRS